MSETQLFHSIDEARAYAANALARTDLPPEPDFIRTRDMPRLSDSDFEESRARVEKLLATMKDEAGL